MSRKPASVRIFQSTRSAWSVTVLRLREMRHLVISIHTLRMERDKTMRTRLLSHWTFQSTRSAWSVTKAKALQDAIYEISIHTLRMERDAAVAVVALILSAISIHTLRMERDLRLFISSPLFS